VQRATRIARFSGLPIEMPALTHSRLASDVEELCGVRVVHLESISLRVQAQGLMALFLSLRIVDADVLAFVRVYPRAACCQSDVPGVAVGVVGVPVSARCSG
jgi:hypothetical protein